jgi:hypothetical protein
MKNENIELREFATTIRKLADRIEAATCDQDFLDCSMDLQEQVWIMERLKVEIKFEREGLN